MPTRPGSCMLTGMRAGSAPTDPQAEPLRWHGTALFNLGFRPFYLLAALLAATALPLWLTQYFGLLTLPSPFAPMTWQHCPLRNS